MVMASDPVTIPRSTIDTAEAEHFGKLA
ncbi:MAG: hypothetical protein JWN66_3572, partial [Sphingomonas bacterium]|nr:hypothetical protein [Sphingomonas bacterium]